jgi:hypothetical protein
MLLRVKTMSTQTSDNQIQQLEKLAQLKSSGFINDTEFEAMKAKTLSNLNSNKEYDRPRPRSFWDDDDNGFTFKRVVKTGVKLVVGWFVFCLFFLILVGWIISKA